MALFFQDIVTAEGWSVFIHGRSFQTGAEGRRERLKPWGQAQEACEERARGNTGSAENEGSLSLPGDN